nr:MAG TPA: hypothetical protein [Caudoviricetes sp.]
MRKERQSEARRTDSKKVRQYGSTRREAYNLQRCACCF